MLKRQVFLLFFLISSLFCSEAKICLSLRLDDDSSQAKKCIESVEKICDCLSICHTRDSLVSDELVLTCALPNRIDRFEKFEEGQAVKTALKTIEEAGFSKEETYILFLGSNDLLKIGSSFSKEALEDDSYLLLSKSSSHYFYDLRLIRAAVAEGFLSFFKDPASYRAPPFSTKLRTLMIEEGSGPQLESLLEFLKKNPKNQVALFALAQAHRQLEHFKEAIRFYQARIDLGDRSEEIWFSKYKIGECHEALDDWETAFRWYLEAFQTDPSRPESLLKIASHYRAAGMNDIAYLFAKYGSEIPFPTMKNLYPFLCNYQFDEELSIASYYTRNREEGYAAANELVLKRNVPGPVRDQTYRNLLFYVPRLKNVRFVNIAFDIPFIEGTQERYHPMNPSIQKTKEGYKVPCRVVSYTQEGAKHFHTACPDGLFRNRNFLLSYDKEFNLLSQHEITENLPRTKTPHFILEGMEDCRLFEMGKSLWFTATCFDTNPTGTLQISLCKLKEKPNGKTLAVEKLVPLLGPDPHRVEKNWLPFIKDNQLHAIYSYDPFIVYRPDLQTGACETVIQYKPVHEFARFRGSAAPIPFDHGYLLMVHEVVFMTDFTRCYLHRFVNLDSNFVVQSLSKPFIFDHTGIEFCCGMTASHSNQELVMAIGLEDREARLGIVDFDTIRSLLEPLPPVIEYPFEE